MSTSKLVLSEKPTLSQLQKYVQDMVQERGFTEVTLSEQFMFLLEECGELAKAARKFTNLKNDKNSESFQVAHEAADVFIFLLDICNKLDIDLEKAFREKEEINKQRQWH